MMSEPLKFTEWVVLSAMSNAQMAGVRNEAASLVVRSKMNREAKKWGPDREGRWTRYGARCVLHRAAVSCAFDVGRCEGGDAQAQAVGTGVRRVGQLGCEWKGADRTGTRVKNSGLATRRLRPVK
jgi:hypothetical protein